MNPSDRRSQVLVTFEETVCPNSDIEFVIAFGSQISGDPTQSSDIDLVIKFVDGLSAQYRFQKRCFLSGNLQQENTPFVDLSDIEEFPIDVANDAVNGEFVCGDREAFERFKAEIKPLFDEQRDTVCRHQQETIDRIVESGLRG